MRGELFEILNALYPTYYIGQHKGICKEPYVVLKFDEENVSTANNLGTFQNFEILIYAPLNSMKVLDEVSKNVKDALFFYEFSGALADYLDEEKIAYMKTLKFRFPKTN